MSQMNRNLRGEVKVQLYERYLTKSEFIRNNFSHKFIQALCLVLKEQSYHPEESLYKKGEHHNKLIMIISGSVQSYVPGNCKWFVIYG